MSFFNVGSILFEKTTTVSEHCISINPFNRWIYQASTDCADHIGPRHEAAITSTPQHGRLDSSPKSSTRSCWSFITAEDESSSDSEQAICTACTPLHISPPDSRPAQSLIPLSHPLRMAFADHQSSIFTRDSISRMVVARDSVSTRHRQPVDPRVVGTGVLWEGKFESE